MWQLYLFSPQSKLNQIQFLDVLCSALVHRLCQSWYCKKVSGQLLFWEESCCKGSARCRIQEQRKKGLCGGSLEFKKMLFTFCVFMSNPVFKSTSVSSLCWCFCSYKCVFQSDVYDSVQDRVGSPRGSVWNRLHQAEEHRSSVLQAGRRPRQVRVSDWVPRAQVRLSEHDIHLHTVLWRTGAHIFSW